MGLFDKVFKSLNENNWGTDFVRTSVGDFVSKRIEFIIRQSHRNRKFFSFFVYDDFFDVNDLLNEDFNELITVKRMCFFHSINLYTYFLVSSNEDTNKLIMKTFHYQLYDENHQNRIDLRFSPDSLEPDEYLDDHLTDWNFYITKLLAVYRGHLFTPKRNFYLDMGKLYSVTERLECFRKALSYDIIYDESELHDLATYVFDLTLKLYTEDKHISTEQNKKIMDAATRRKKDFINKFKELFLALSSIYSKRVIDDIDRGWGHWSLGKSFKSL